MISVISFIVALVCFIVAITLLTVVHEFGHYYFARMFGVRVNIFAIGFGKNLFEYIDKSNTHWKINMIPLGGYVKMHGDMFAYGGCSIDEIENLSEDEKKETFFAKKLWQRFLIVLAGPVFNFILAIGLIWGIYCFHGHRVLDPIVGKILENGPAERAGLQSGDVFLKINKKVINNFYDLHSFLAMNYDKKFTVEYKRGEDIFSTELTPEIIEKSDEGGQKFKMGFVGIFPGEMRLVRLGLFEGLQMSVLKSFNIGKDILKALQQMFVGKRSVKEVGGPMRIANVIGKSITFGLSGFLWMVALFSINLGVINLLPIPVLDGGHLFYYCIELLRGGKPMPVSYQNFGFKFGMIVLMCLMLLASCNDIWFFILRHLKYFK